jgi:acyl-coenzyme A synthetase/AMP-(fatty) acid ligase
LTDFRELERFSGNPALVLPEETISYRDLADMADRSAQNLRQGELVAIECINTTEPLAAYLGTQRRGIPALLVDAGLAPQMRESLYERYRVAAVFDARASAWVRRHPNSPALHTDLALLLSTSGSTGSPKLVRLSGANISANAAAIATYLGLTAEERPITTLPFHYSFGLSIVNSHLSVGAALVLTDLTMAQRGFWERLAAGNATSISGVPMMFDILRRLRVESMQLPSLRTLTQAGGRLAPASVLWMAELAQRRHWRFFVMYGQTEATARMAYLPPDQVQACPDSIGQPIPGGRFSIEDESGNVIVEPGHVGELIYHGPNVMMGYAEDPRDLSLGDVQGGRLATGDLAECGSNGFYYLRGRRARFLKVFGNRIGLDDVEKELEHGGYPVVATGRDDKIVLAATDAAVLEPARAHVCELFRIHRSAIAIVQLREVPRSAAGKVRYAEILALFEQGEGLSQ